MSLTLDISVFGMASLFSEPTCADLPCLVPVANVQTRATLINFAFLQFSYSEVLSILGMLVLNTIFLEINWGIITQHEEYVPFPAACLHPQLCV